jgi:hypothetical protein
MLAAVLDVHVVGDTAAYVAAAAALVGVVVGGLLNAGVTVLLRRSDDKRNARVAALLVTEDLMISMPPMLQLKEEQTWRPIKVARNFASRGSWEEHRGTLAHSISTPAYISLSGAFEGLAHAADGAAERADDAPLTDAEGWPLASTFLAMNRGMSYLTLLVDVPPRWRPVRRLVFKRAQQAHADDLLEKDVPYQEFMKRHGRAAGS